MPKRSQPRAAGGWPGRRPPTVRGDTATDLPVRLDHVPAIIYVADAGASRRWYYVSPQIEAILGFSPEDWCADPGLWVAQLHPTDRDRVLAHESGSSDQPAGVSALEYRLRHRDGHAVWIRDDAMLVRDQTGVPRWHGVLTDVTDRKRVEAELERRAAQQSAVARLGEHALEGASTVKLMQEAVREAAEILDVETGYSSLGYLTQLPLDALKVDRSFVDGLGIDARDSAITQAIIAMAHALSLEVVAEGVETTLQLTELTRLGCDLAQGFHFCRPVPPATISEMLLAPASA